MPRFERVVFVLALAGLLVPPQAFAEKASADGATLRFGDSVTVAKSVDIAKLSKKPAKLEGKTVRLEGTVKEVCQGSGCWVEVQTSKGASFMARSLDHSVLLPTDCKDLPIVVQGVVTKLVAEKEEEHAAEGHVCPQPEWVVSMLAVELKEPAKPAEPEAPK